MSYDISLLDPVSKETIQLDEPHFMRGGTYAVGGTTDLHLNVTYNYGKHFYNVTGDNGIRTIYGMTGAETMPILKKAIEALGDDTHHDYWRATEGNAKRALIQLLSMANMRPDGIWDGD